MPVLARPARTLAQTERSNPPTQEAISTASRDHSRMDRGDLRFPSNLGPSRILNATIGKTKVSSELVSSTDAMAQVDMRDRPLD